MQGLTKPPAVIPWSYSTLTAFEQCPRRYYLTKVAKQVTEPQTEATLEGNRAHKAFEYAVAGTQDLPTVYKHYQPIVDRLRATPGQKIPEQKWALTASLKPTTFFAKDAWARGVIDLTILRGHGHANLIDYKTGKVKEDTNQLELFAAVAFALYPAVQTVDTAYLWVNKNKVTPQRVVRDDAPIIWQGFVGRVKRMEHALTTDDFPPRPSGLCKEWCPVGKALCEFCGK